MTPFALYIIKAGICLTLFAVLFRLLLLRETFFRFTRIVLLTGMLTCSVLPFINISTAHPSALQQFTIRLEQAVEAIQPQESTALTTAPVSAQMQTADEAPVASSAVTPTSTPINWLAIIGTIYLIGVALMILRLVIALIRLRQLLKGNTVESDNGYRLVITDEDVMPFSFFRYIVLSQKDYNDNPEAIILHEQMHMRKLHNLDIILAEIVLTLHWFNPMVWMLTRDLREIHEYEADSAVLAQGIAAQQYQLLLVKKAVGEKRFAAVVNNFNQSKIKNRITMMLKNQSTPWARLKALFIVPFVALALLAFSTIDQVMPEKPYDSIKEEAIRRQALDYLLYMQGDTPNRVGYIYIDTNERVYVKHMTEGSYATISTFDMNDGESMLKVLHTIYDQALANGAPTLSFVIGAQDEVKMEFITYVKQQLHKAYKEWSSALLDEDRAQVEENNMLVSLKYISLNDAYISTAEKISKNPLYYWEEVQRLAERTGLDVRELTDREFNKKNNIIILINSVNELMIQSDKSTITYKTPENLEISAEYIDKMMMLIADVVDSNPTSPIYFTLQKDAATSNHVVHNYLTYALPMAYDKALSHQAARLRESALETKSRYPLLLFFYSGNFDLPDEWREHGKYYYAWSESEGETKSSQAMIGPANMPVEGDAVYPLTNPDRLGVSMVTLGAGVTRDDLQSVLSHLDGKITDRVLYVFRSGD